MRRVVITTIVLYQKWISPILPPTCRFHPSCSEYTRQAFGKYGCLKGVVLSAARLARCHPWNAGGIDPVP